MQDRGDGIYIVSANKYACIPAFKASDGPVIGGKVDVVKKFIQPLGVSHGSAQKGKEMKGIVLVAMTCFIFSGCASVTTGTTQGVTLEVTKPDGEIVQGARCVAENDRATIRFRSGEKVKIRRAESNLNVTCSSDGFPDAEGTLVSSGNYVGLGNILVGGLVGMTVDAITDADKKYPDWVRLVLGEWRIFNPREDKTRSPMVGVVSSSTNTVVAQNVAAAELVTPQAPPLPQLHDPDARSAPSAPSQTVAPEAGWRNWGQKEP